MRALAIFLLVLVLILLGCRSDVERTAVAQAPGVDGAGSVPSAPTSASSSAVGEGAEAASRLRRLWSGSDFNFFASSPSPDGRYVTEIDWSTGDLAVRDLVTARLHRLTDKGPWERSGDYAEVARFSPDGRRIAYGWYHQSTDSYEVRLLDFSVDADGAPRGSDPRVVHPGGPQYVFWLYGWSPDDELLTGLYRPDNSTALGFLSLESGELRVLKSFEWEDPRAALSPRGDRVVYDHPPGTDKQDRDLYLMAADGSEETRLTQGPERDVVLGWVPREGSLLFYRESSGTGGIWLLPMSGSQPSGPAELVRAGVTGLEPLGFAGEQYYFGHEVEAPRFRKARIDLQDRRLVGEETLFDSSPGEAVFQQSMAWSPTGEYILHLVGEGPTRSRLILSAADGTPIQTWHVDFRLRRWMLRWSPDGKALLIPAQDHRGREGLFRWELASGQAEPFRRFEPGMGQVFSLSPDGRTLYFPMANGVEDESGQGLAAIVAHDLSTGEERVIHHVPYHGAQLGVAHSSPLAITPDGDHMAYPEIGPERETVLRLLPLEGGPPRTLRRIPPPGLSEILGWSPDGDHLYVLLPGSGDDGSSDEDTSPDSETWATGDVELWRISFDGDTAEPIGVIRDYLGGAVLHPDGVTLAYRSGRPRGEIWALDGFGPSSTEQEGANR